MPARWPTFRRCFRAFSLFLFRFFRASLSSRAGQIKLAYGGRVQLQRSRGRPASRHPASVSDLRMP